MSSDDLQSVPHQALSAPAIPVRGTPRWIRKPSRHRFGHLGIHLLLLPGALSMLIPLLWMLSTALKEPNAIFVYPPQVIPDPIVFDNFPKAFEELPFARAYFNSLYIAVLVTIGNLITCSLAGYAFARLQFKGAHLAFFLILASMMVPLQITLMPSFILYEKIGWLDTHYPLIVPAILSNPFGVFLMRQFIRTLPRELEDAARVDGANPFRIYYQIVLPLVKPALSAVGIFTFMATFNDFLAPLIFLSSPEKMTVPVLLAAFEDVYGTVQWGPMMAATSMALLPVILVYVFAQRYFIEGVAMSGMKG